MVQGAGEAISPAFPSFSCPCLVLYYSVMCSLLHLVPYPLDLDQEQEVDKHYAEDHKILIELLESSFDGLFLNIYTFEFKDIKIFIDLS